MYPFVRFSFKHPCYPCQLVSEIKRIGKINTEGKTTITYGDLMVGTDHLFEALLGTLLSAKKHKVSTREEMYEGPFCIRPCTN